jgi:hypothetical protein
VPRRRRRGSDVAYLGDRPGLEAIGEVATQRPLAGLTASNAMRTVWRGPTMTVSAQGAAERLSADPEGLEWWPCRCIGCAISAD